MSVFYKYISITVHFLSIHRVSEKAVQNCFCQNFVKFLSMLKTLGGG